MFYSFFEKQWFYHHQQCSYSRCAHSPMDLGSHGCSSNSCSNPPTTENRINWIFVKFKNKKISIIIKLWACLNLIDLGKWNDIGRHLVFYEEWTEINQIKSISWFLSLIRLYLGQIPKNINIILVLYHSTLRIKIQDTSNGIY